MKALEDIKVDLVNSKWLSFNNIDIKEDKMFRLLSKLLKKEEIVYSAVTGDILLEDKVLNKKAKKLAKMQQKFANSGKPLNEKAENKMDLLSADLDDPKTPGKAIIVITDDRIITIYEDINKMYKLKTLIKALGSIEELNAGPRDPKEETYNFDIGFGKATVNLVTKNQNDIKHFEFTLDQLIELQAKKDIEKELVK